jgi:hypothetical protein
MAASRATRNGLGGFSTLSSPRARRFRRKPESHGIFTPIRNALRLTGPATANLRPK